MATLRETFKDIADAIREKGVSGTFKPIEMASKIESISTSDGTKYGVSMCSIFGDVDANGVYQHPSEKFKFNGVGIKEITLETSLRAVFLNNRLIEEFNMPDLETLSGNGSPTSGCCLQACMNSSVVKASMPKLVSLGDYVCYQMFYNCRYLTTAPSELPATTMANYCYAGMFYGCSSLTEAPELPATTMANYCYWSMFQNCTSLTQAPELPATTLANYCYNSMFQGCTSLTQAPELPATTLASYCYQYMFYGCTSLTQAPELPATTMADNCYNSMFQYCTSLKRIKMNASSGNWGASMFSGCTSLELIDMTGSTGVPQLSNVNNFNITNSTYKIVVPDSLYNTWIAATNWSSASIKPHIMKQSDWNSTHPDDILP